MVRDVTDNKTRITANVSTEISVNNIYDGANFTSDKKQEGFQRVGGGGLLPARGPPVYNTRGVVFGQVACGGGRLGEGTRAGCTSVTWRLRGTSD